MEQIHNNSIGSTSGALPKRINFFRKAKAAMANPPAPPNGRRKSIILRSSFYKGAPKIIKTAVTLSHEQRRSYLFTTRGKRLFWAKVNRGVGCWLWQGSTVTRGYGEFVLNGVGIMAHRYAYISTYGPIADNLHVHHKCEVVACVRPDHLEALTPVQHKRAHEEMRLRKPGYRQGASYAAAQKQEALLYKTGGVR